MEEVVGHMSGDDGDNSVSSGDDKGSCSLSEMELGKVETADSLV